MITGMGFAVHFLSFTYEREVGTVGVVQEDQALTGAMIFADANLGSGNIGATFLIGFRIFARAFGTE
jgi:hypothetical protein